MTSAPTDCTVVMIPGMQCTEDTFIQTADELQLCLPDIRILIAPISAGSLAGAVSDLTSHSGTLIAIGHSLGGTVAMAAARTRPDRIHGLATICANPLPPRPSQLQSWAAQADRVASGGFQSDVDELLPLLCGPDADPELLRRTRKMMIATGPEGLMAQLAVQRQRVDERPGLAVFTGPVLAIGAGRDQLVAAAATRAIAHAAPRGRPEFIPDAGHMLPMQHPRMLANLLAEWIRNPDPDLLQDYSKNRHRRDA